jgi:hypothetical protein
VIPFIMGTRQGDLLGRALSQPYFEKSVKMRLTLPKWELRSPLGPPKFQSLIAGVKTPRIVTFFISLESYQNLNVKNGLA